MGNVVKPQEKYYLIGDLVPICICFIFGVIVLIATWIGELCALYFQDEILNATAISANPAAISVNPAANPAAISANPAAISANPATISANPAAISVNPAAISANPATVSANAAAVKRKCCYTNCTRRLTSFLLHMFYGESTQLVHSSAVVEQQNEEGRIPTFIHKDEITSNHCCLHCCLSSNVIIFTTLLFMIFFERYIIKSEFGCVVGRNCYKMDNNVNELPISNCTQFEDSETLIVCYNLKLGFLSALGDTGGVPPPV